MTTLARTLACLAWMTGLALAATPNQGDPLMQDERYARGWHALTQLAPERAQAVQDNLADIAPDLGTFIVAFGYGDIFTRPGLSPALRQTVTIAALTALGNAAPQLAFHIEAGLATGLSPEEIIEILYVTTVFAGFPAGLNAIATARQVFTAKHLPVTPPTAHAPSDTDRHQRGLTAVSQSSQNAGQHVLDALADIAPDMADFILDFSYGDVISRTVLSPAQKELAMIAAATARGTMAPQLAVHIKAARQVGVTRQQIVETIIQMAAYAGFPAAINGMTTARSALRELGE